MRTIDDVIRILVTKAGSPTLLTELTIEDMELWMGVIRAFLYWAGNEGYLDTRCFELKCHT